MTDVPKCKSWMGHKFEARYSSAPVLADWPAFEAEGHAAIVAQVALRTRQTYECDVCVRCGHVVQPASKAA